MTLDTSNQFGVSAPAVGDGVEIALLYLLVTKGGRLAKAEALVLAAWLVALADPDPLAAACGPTHFQAILQTILK